ncbi:MAG: hypothetical protein ACKVP4_00960 [Hyphomicrobium sp.]
MADARPSFPIAAVGALLAERYPGLALDEDDHSVQGTYDLFHDRTWLDSYLIRVDLPDAYPRGLPAVYEIGGRIPRTDAYHVNADGSLCLGVPEELWIKHVGRFEIDVILDGPLRTFLLGATDKLKGRDWPYGERAHGPQGLCQFYAPVIGSSDPLHVLDLIQMLSAKRIKGHWPCPCGSNLQLRKCHGEPIRELHAAGFPPLMLHKSAILLAPHPLQTVIPKQRH